MAISTQYHEKVATLNAIKSDIKKAKKFPELAGLFSAPVFHGINSLKETVPGLNLALGPALGLWSGLQVNAIEKQKLNIFKPSPIDENYRESNISDTCLLDRINLGMAMRLDDYKSGFDVYCKATGTTGADAIKAYQAARAKDFYPVYMPDDYLTRHMSFLGQTGVGKTEAQLAMLAQSIARGGGGIMIEMKGDGLLPARAYQLAKAYGAEKRFRLISLDDIDISLKYNPLASSTNRTAISTIMSLLSSEGQQFHKDVAKWGLYAAILTINAQPARPAYTLQELFFLLGDINEFYQYYLNMDQNTEDEIASKLFVRDFFIQFQNGEDDEGNIVWNYRNYTERMMGVKAALQSFAQGDFAKVLCTPSPDLDLRRAIENGEIVVLSANTLSDSEGVATFGRLFMADLAAAIGAIQKNGTKPLIPFPIWLDEYPSFKHTFHQKLFQLARSANVGLIIGAQGFEFLADGQEGSTFARNVLANCWNHFFFDIRDDSTKDLAAKLAGTVIREMETRSEGQSNSENHDKSKGSIVGSKSSGKSTSTSTKATREDEILPEDLKLDAGDAILVSKFDTMRVRLPFIEFNEPAPDLRDESYKQEVMQKDQKAELGILKKMARLLESERL